MSATPRSGIWRVIATFPKSGDINNGGVVISIDDQFLRDYQIEEFHSSGRLEYLEYFDNIGDAMRTALEDMGFGTFDIKNADEPDNRVFYVNVYELDRVYGGPEEGGWYFTAGTPVESIRCIGEAEADVRLEEAKRKYPNEGDSSSVVYAGGEYLVQIEERFAVAFPHENPVYE